MLKFWKWLRAFSEQKIRDAHMQIHHSETRCPHCNTWSSLMDSPTRFEEIAGGFYRQSCGQCPGEAVFDFNTPVPLMVEKHSNKPRRQIMAYAQTKFGTGKPELYEVNFDGETINIEDVMNATGLSLEVSLWASLVESVEEVMETVSKGPSQSGEK